MASESALESLIEVRLKRAGGARTVTLMALVILAGALLYLLLVPEVDLTGNRRLVGPLLLILTSSAGLYMLHLKRVGAAFLILLWGTWAVIGIASVLVAGLRTAVIYGYPIVIMASSLLSRRAVVATGAASIACVIALGLAEHLGVLAAPLPPPLIVLGIVLVLVLIASTLLIAFIATEQEQWQQRESALRQEVSAKMQALGEQARELRLITDNVPVLVCAYDGMVCRFANPRYAEFFGFTAETIVGMHLREIIGGTAFEHARPLVERVLAGEPVGYRGRRSSPAFGERFMEVKLVPGEPEPGKPRGFYGVFFDVTEQELAAEAVRASEAWLRLAGDSAQVGLWEWDIATDRLTWNDGLKTIFGLPPERRDLFLPDFLAAIHPDDVEETRRAFMTALEHRGEFDHEYRIVRPGGEVRWIAARGAGEYGNDGKPLRMTGAALDITERRRTEAALRDSEARLRDAQRIGRVGSWELDLASKRMSWSDELHRIYERDRDGFGGTWQDLLNLVHPDDVAKMRETWKRAADTAGNVELHHRILTPDGRTKHLHVRFEVFRDAEGRPVRALGTAQDITEQVLARQEIERLNAELERRVLERTAELTAANRELASFAYSISHDLRAPLRGIDGFSKLLVDEYRERLDAEGIDYLDRVRRAAQRMGTLIDDILELSRVTRQEMRRVSVDLSQVAAELLDERARAEPVTASRSSSPRTAGFWATRNCCAS